MEEREFEVNLRAVIHCDTHVKVKARTNAEALERAKLSSPALDVSPAWEVYDFEYVTDERYDVTLVSNE